MATDGWLERHLAALGPGPRVLELGCGRGDDALWLTERGCVVTACEFEPGALQVARTTIGTERLLRVDHRSPLPFRDASFDVVVASLSLHYFHWETTLGIFAEIRRVLRPRSVLVFRVNASDDVESGALDGHEVEPGLRVYDERGPGYESGDLKRFFDEAAVRACLGGFELEVLEHRIVSRWSKPKQVWECRSRRSATSE